MINRKLLENLVRQVANLAKPISQPDVGFKVTKLTLLQEWWRTYGVHRHLSTPVKEVIQDMVNNPRNWRVRIRKSESANSIYDEVNKWHEVHEGVVAHKPSGKVFNITITKVHEGWAYGMIVEDLGFRLTSVEEDDLTYVCESLMIGALSRKRRIAGSKQRIEASAKKAQEALARSALLEELGL